MTSDEAFGSGATPSAIPRRGRLGAWLASELADWIIRSGLQAGDSMPPEAELAATYGVSVRVVRDALRALGGQGIVETSQGRRAVVSDRRSEAVEGYFKFATASDRKAIPELFEVRIALETRAAGLAAANATDAERAAIRDALQRMIEAPASIEEYVDADLGWHAALIAASHNRFLVGMHAALAQVLRTERTRSAVVRLQAGRTADRTIREHAAITDKVLAGDRQGSEQAMLSHLEATRRLYDAFTSAEHHGPGSQRTGDVLPTGTSGDAPGRGTAR